MILSAVIAKVRDDSGIDCYPVSAPPNPVAPYAVINLDGADQMRHYGSGVGYETGVNLYDFEVQVFGVTPDIPIDNMTTIVAGLQNFSGPLTGLNALQYEIMDIEITGQFTDYDDRRELFYQSAFITVSTRS